MRNEETQVREIFQDSRGVSGFATFEKTCIGFVSIIFHESDSGLDGLEDLAQRDGSNRVRGESGRLRKSTQEV